MVSHSVMERNLTLDVLRGIAASSVLLFHYTYGYREYYGHILNPKYDFIYGNLGVELFFIISGYVIFSSITKVNSAKNFLFRRFSRIYPTFWFCMFVSFFLVILFLPGHVENYQLKWTATMISSFFGCKPTEGVYWTLLYEFFFYIQIALLLFLKQIDNIIWWGVLQLSLIWINAFTHLFNIKFCMAANLDWGMLFFVGILFYKLKNSSDKGKWSIHVLIALCYLTSCITLQFFSERIAVLIFFIIFYLFSFGLLDWVKWKPFIFLGSISYPLYLLHMSIGYIIMNAIKGYFTFSPFIFICIPALIVVLLAYFVHRFIETPTNKYLRGNKYLIFLFK